MLALHHAAAKARLELHASLAGYVDSALRTTREGQPVSDNYVVLKTALPNGDPDRLSSEQGYDTDAELELFVRAVAVDIDGLHALIDAVHEQFAGHRLSVAGRTMTALERTDMSDGDLDPATRLLYMDAVYEATSNRA